MYTTRGVLLVLAFASTAGAAGLSSEAATAQADHDVTIVVPDEPIGLDGCNSDQANVGRVIKGNVAESLTALGPDGTLQPMLATGWTQVDADTWRFDLRQGVSFHDGEPFNAETAVIAIDRTMGVDPVTGEATELGCRTRSKFFAGIDLKPVAIDANTIEITATGPVPILPTQLAGLSIVSPRTPTDGYVREPIGTGPYIFDHWTPGVEILLTRNDGYWGEKPQVSSAQFIWREDSSIRAAMVELGEADLAPIIAVQDANDPGTDRGYLNSETTIIRIDTETPPLDDIRVRQALNLALDREGIRASLLPEESLLAEQPIGPRVPGFNHEIGDSPTPYDPERATQLVQAAKADGAPVDREIPLIARPGDYPNSKEALEAMTSMFQAVGLNVKLSVRESAQWLEAFRKPFPPDRGPTLLATSHTNDSGDSASSITYYFVCDGNASMVCDPAFDAQVAEANATPSGPERDQKWHDIMQVMHDDIVPDVWLFHMMGFARVGSRINFEPNYLTNSQIQLADISFN